MLTKSNFIQIKLVFFNYDLFTLNWNFDFDCFINVLLLLFSLSKLFYYHNKLVMDADDDMKT